MAAYPMLGQTTQSRETIEDNVFIDRASNGTARGRVLWTAPKYTLQLQHIVARADVDTLLAFYAANRALEVTVVWDGNGQTYTMMFDGAPKPEHIGGLEWRVTTKLVEV